MKRVLFVSNLFPRPDVPQCGVFNAAFVLALNTHLSLAGGGVEVVVPVPEWRVNRWRGIRRWEVPDLSGNFTGCPVRYVPCFHIPLVGRSLAWIFHLVALRAACVTSVRDCDAVLGSWLYPDAAVAQRLAAGAGKPCWIRLHGTDRFHLDAAFRGAVCRRALAACAGILVNAQFMKRELVRRGIAENGIAVVPNGIDRDVFHPGAARLRERNLVLWTGNLVGIKRPELALHAFARFQDGREAARLVIAGGGVLRARLERLSRRLGIADRVLFAGMLGRQELADQMRRAGALLLTSRSEGMPNVVIEALACGTPVVSTAVGDVPTVVQNGRNGFVVESGNNGESAARLADALQQTANIEWSSSEISDAISQHDWNCSAATALKIMKTAESGSPRKTVW